MRTIKLVSMLMVASAAYGAVDLGDEAPPLDVAKWIVGKPADLSSPDGKTIYVVEFWATWCPPCRASIPHLNEMHHKLRDKGVVIIGISGEDAATVEPFVKEMKMEYRVAVDRGDATSDAYTDEGSGIPQAFVVDSKGIVVWSGHPMSGLDSAVQSLLAGTYSLERAKKAKAVSKALDRALGQNDLEGALAAVDELTKLEPKVRAHYDMKIRLLKHAERIKEVVTLRRKMAVAFASSASDLTQIARGILAEEDVRLRDLKLALECAKTAAELTEHRDTDVLPVLARAYADVGLCRPAIATLKKAMALEQDERKRQMLQYMIQYVRQLKTCQDLAPRETE